MPSTNADSSVSTVSTPIVHSVASNSPHTRRIALRVTSRPAPAAPDATRIGSLMISVSVGRIARPNRIMVTPNKMIGRILKMKSTFLNIFAIDTNTFASLTIFWPFSRITTDGCSSVPRNCSSVGANSSLPMSMYFSA